jgi:hypothetical protein
MAAAVEMSMVLTEESAPMGGSMIIVSPGAPVAAMVIAMLDSIAFVVQGHREIRIPGQGRDEGQKIELMVDSLATMSVVRRRGGRDEHGGQTDRRNHRDSPDRPFFRKH